MLILPEAYALMAAIALTGIVPLVLRASSTEFLKPRFWIVVVYLVLFVVRPWYILTWCDKAHCFLRGRPDFPELVINGLLLALAGLACFWLGHSSSLGKRLGSAVPVLPQRISPARWRQAVVGCLVVGLVAYLLLLRQIGGFKNLMAFLYMRGVVYAADEAAGPLKEGAKLVGVAAILGMHYHLGIIRTRWAWPLLLFSSVIMGTMGSRGSVAQLWVATYVLHALHEPRYRSWKTLGWLLLIIAVFASAYLGFRRATRKSTQHALQSFRELPQEFTENLMDSAPMFDHMLGAMRVSGRAFPWREGKTYIDLFPAMVPRAVWPYDMEGAGPMLREAIEPLGTRGGRPSSAMGEGYMNFGVIGALVPMFFLGLWCRVIHIYMLRTNGRSQIAPLLYTFALLGTPRLLAGVFALALREMIIRLVASLAAFFWAAHTRDVDSAAEQPRDAMPAQPQAS